MWINFIGPLGLGEALVTLLFILLPVLIIIFLVVKILSISRTVDEINRKLDEKQ